VLVELAAILPELSARATLLDVGSGVGDIAAEARDLARNRQIDLSLFTIDMAEPWAVASRARAGNAVRGSATALPFADRSVDIVLCSQTLHHFDDTSASCVLRELDRVARRQVVVSDLRRSWLAACGFWLVSWPLGFSPVTRHDGTLSVLRGFTAAELAHHVQQATGRRATIRRRLGWRLTASWEKRAP
jgi:ubiquinone/menaquinone biosynthesis C-methylase UbiE